MQRTKVKCELCGQEISKSNYTKHIGRHEKHPETFEKPPYSLDHDGLICQYCGKEWKNRNSLCTHERQCEKNPKRQKIIIEGFNNVGRTAWNKGLTKETDERVKQRGEKLHNRYVNKELIRYNLGSHHTEEEKYNLSRKMKDFLSKNPDKVPYILNHSSKMSYPEKYFIDLFEKESINLIYHYRINKYELDFCDLNKKIDVEIDGDQHYLDKRIVKSDKERDSYLNDLGWKIIRIRWSEYKKLSYEEKSFLINQLKASLA